MNLVSSQSCEQLLLSKAQLAKTIERFTPKRRKELERILECTLGSIEERKRLEDLVVALEAKLSSKNDSSPKIMGLYPAIILESIRLLDSWEREAHRLNFDIRGRMASIQERIALIVVAMQPSIEVALHPAIQSVVLANLEKCFQHAPSSFDSIVLAGLILCSTKAHECARALVPQNSLCGVAVAMAAYATSPKPPLSGVVRYDELDGTDFILAARYCSDPQDWPRLNVNPRPLDLNSLKTILDDDHFFRLFARGLQPRAAEIAFGRLYSTIFPNRESRLVDLNREALDRSLEKLPAEDWEDGSSFYDVKCNLFFQSSQTVTGMVGITVGRSRSPNTHVAAFVIHQATESYAKWSFLGMLSEAGISREREHVSACLFSLPTTFSLQHPDLSAFTPELRKLLRGIKDNLPIENSKVRLKRSDVLAAALSIEIMTQGDQANWLEILWIRLARAVCRRRAMGQSAQETAELLRKYEASVESRWWMFHLVRIESQTLASKYISSVLSELNRDFHKIRCPSCGTTEHFEVIPERMSRAGTISGSARCKCGFFKADLTIIARCQGCGKSPIIIGKNEVCDKCFGLRCDRLKPRVCRACKCSDSREPIVSLPTPDEINAQLQELLETLETQ